MQLEPPENRKSASRSRAEPPPIDADPSPEGARNLNVAAYRSSDEIFNGLREIVINHNGAEYRLRITSSGKLILTK